MTPRRPLILHRFLAAALVLCILPLTTLAADTSAPIKIATIGSGHLGGTIGELLARAGHPVFFSSRHPEELKSLVAESGPNARAGTVEDAIRFADVILLAVPYSAVPEVGRDYGKQLAGKVILDACNPIPRRDGKMAEAALEKGSGVATSEYIPGASVVRAFSNQSYKVFASEAHRPAPQLAVPLAGDDRRALGIAVQLVRDAGFEPVVVGDLTKSKEFDVGSRLFVKPMTAKQLRQALGMQ